MSTNITVQDAKNDKQWNEYVTSHKESNFLQSWQWGEFHKSRGDGVIRRIISDDKNILGVYEGVVENAKRGRYLEIAGGPIIDWNNHEAVAAFKNDLVKQAKKHKCVFARVRPQLELSDSSKNIFREIGFKKAPMYLSVEYAGLLNLDKSEEDILKGMRQRLRRALRKAEKNNIVVEKSTDPEKIHEFYNIQLNTATRHGFIPFSDDFLYKQFKAFAATGNAVLYIAKYNDQILAENFMIFYGNEASYHYGVSTELGTKLSGAPLLHMEAMRDARKRKISRYNFWGIVDENDTKHRFYGVSVFKRGFGVDEYKYLPAQDIVINKKLYWIDWTVETLRRKLRHV